MCDNTKQEAFDQIHSTAVTLLSDITNEIPDESKKRLRHGLDLIISLSRYQHNLVTQGDRDILKMNS